MTKHSLDALRRERQKIAFDANVQRIYRVDTPYAVRCLQRYEELTREINELEMSQKQSRQRDSKKA